MSELSKEITQSVSYSKLALKELEDYVIVVGKKIDEMQKKEGYSYCMRGPVADLSGYVPSTVERAHHAKCPDQVQEISLQDHPNTSNLCRYATLQTGSIDECKRKPNQYEEARKIDFHETLFNSTFFKRY